MSSEELDYHYVMDACRDSSLPTRFLVFDSSIGIWILLLMFTFSTNVLLFLIIHAAFSKFVELRGYSVSRYFSRLLIQIGTFNFKDHYLENGRNVCRSIDRF